MENERVRRSVKRWERGDKPDSRVVYHKGRTIGLGRFQSALAVLRCKVAAMREP